MPGIICIDTKLNQEKHKPLTLMPSCITIPMQWQTGLVYT